MKHSKTCEYCGNNFISQRSETLTCSPNCRARNNEKKRTEKYYSTDVIPMVKENAKTETLLLVEAMKQQKLEALFERARVEMGVTKHSLPRAQYENWLKHFPDVDSQIHSLQNTLEDFHFREKIKKLVGSGAEKILCSEFPDDFAYSRGRTITVFNDDGFNLVPDEENKYYRVVKGVDRMGHTIE